MLPRRRVNSPGSFFRILGSLAGSGFALLLTAVTPLNLAAAAAEDFYPLGFAWERNLDWQTRDAADAGSSLGNPIPDTLGNEVWHYGSIDGGSALGSVNPWYLLPSTPMVWEPSSLGSEGGGSWIREAPALSPSSSRFSLFHETQSSQYSPEISWSNPTGRHLSLRITGTIKVRWDSAQLTQTPVDIAIVRKAGASVTQTLLADTLPMPAPVGTTASAQFPVDLFAEVGISESIRITARMQSSEHPTQVAIQDGLTISIISDDVDSDGLSNAYEKQLGTSPIDADSDNDGWSDQCENEFAGNPIDPQKIPDFIAYVTSSPGSSGLSVRYPAARSQDYLLEESGDLMQWTTPGTAIPGDGETADVPVPPQPAGSRFFRVKSEPPAPDPVVESYRNATGISESSADAIRKMLTQLRSVGMDPDFFWVGGSRYNQPDQTRAVIGGTAAIVGAGTALPYAETENACRFNRGKFLQFDQPEILRSVAIENLAIAVWFEELDYTSESNVFSTYDPTAKGMLLQQWPDGQVRLFSFASATAGSPTSTYAVPTWSLNVGKRAHYYRIERLSPTSTFIHGLLDTNTMATATSAVFNNHTKIKIGGNSLNATATIQPRELSNCRVTAVAIARTGPIPKTMPLFPGSGVNVVVGDKARTVTDAPYTAGILPRQDFPSVLTLGDSTTATKWNMVSFLTPPFAGAWLNNAVVEDYGAGGSSMDYHVALTPYVNQHLQSPTYGPRYLVYTPEGLLDEAATALGLSRTDPVPWYNYAENWLEGIQERSRCIMVLSSYIGGNTSDTENGKDHRDIVRNWALAHNWYYIPMWEDPHSKVFTGSVPGSYGFYIDTIHQSDRGKQIQAEVFSAAIPHLIDTSSPRADLNNTPRLSGENSVGDSLSCTTGKWFHFPSDFSYQWLRNLTPISGATSPTYVIQPADQGTRIACRVVANKTGNRSASFTSPPTGEITP